MKIGIVTFFNVRNYGAMLQARSLCSFLTERGHQVEFLNYPWGNSDVPRFLLKFLTTHLKFNRYEIEKYYNHRATAFAHALSITKPVMTVEDARSVSRDWDVAIVGSDQMWNPNWTPNDRLPLVFLDFVGPKTRRIAYAVSWGVKEWNRADKDEVGDLLRKFSAISVRESSGVDLVERLSGLPAVCLPDPTLLNRAEYYQQWKVSGPVSKFPYVFGYFIPQPGANNDGVECAELCKRVLGIELTITDRELPKDISGRLICRLAGVCPQVSVPEWLSRLSGSSFVVTNSFHGTIFSLIFHRPFLSVFVNGPLSGMNERLVSLLRAVGLEDRAVCENDKEKFAAIVKREINWTKVDDRLAEFRQHTEQFFEEQGL